MKRSIHCYLFIIVIQIQFSCIFANYCSKSDFEASTDHYIHKDFDMCTMFMQSYDNSIYMNMSVTNYLLQHLQDTYIKNGHLRSFTQYPNNYTFLLASAIDHIESDDHHKTMYRENKANQLKDAFYDDASADWKFKSIDWDQSYTDIYKDIREKFQITEDCTSVITFYLTFPSYPENNLLLDFLKRFESVSSASASSTAFNNDNNLYYRNTVDPSFLFFVDTLPLQVFQEILRQHGNVRLVFCGHGLGGTLAQLSTLHLLSKEVNTDHPKLRSISIGSLFFAKEDTVEFVKNHHLEQHFINTYHEMDVIPSLFNMAGLLSKLSVSIVGAREPTLIWKIVDGVKSFLRSDKNQIEKHRIYLKHILSSLCQSLVAAYSMLPSKLCEQSVVDKTLDVLKEAWKYSGKFSDDGQISKLIYHPIGIFNLITFRKYDESWHLVNVINMNALNDYLNAGLDQLSKSEQIFRNHPITHYMMALHQCNEQKPTSTHTQTLLNLIKSFVKNENAKVPDPDVKYPLSLNDNSDSSIVIPLPFRPSSSSYTAFRFGASYMSMIAVPPVLPFDNSTSSTSRFDLLTRKFLSAIKHRTDVFKLNFNNKLQAKNVKLSDRVSLYDICLFIYEMYGMDGRMELMKLQLDQRMLVPILVSTNRILPPSDSFLTNPSHFRSYIKTLSLVENAVLQRQEILLANDSELLRIGLISTKKGGVGGLPNLIKSIFQVSSIRQFSQGMGSGIKAETIAETGYGFLPTDDRDLRYQPVILIHIIGDYRPLISFLVQYVDALIVEHNEEDDSFADFVYDQLFQSLRIPRIMKWKHTISEEFDEMISCDEPYHVAEYAGSVPAVTSAFQTHLLEYVTNSNSYLSSKTSSTASMVLVRPRLIDLIEDKVLNDDDIPLLDAEALFQNVNISQVKRENFRLQQSYKKEAENHLEMDNPTWQLNVMRMKELEQNIREERQFRAKIYQTIEEIPILESYISLISEPNAEKRYTHKRHFEFILSTYNEASTTILRKRKDELFIRMKEADTVSLTDKKLSNDIFSSKEKSIKDYYQAKTDFIEKSLVIDHFWREISHLFVVNQTKYQKFPHLAAQHLIDGFSLELLDGDSMLLNIQWIEQVLYSLDKILSQELGRSARILVLSICGPQSSGKSSLLKTMYGLRIRSSVGACTQGVNMMLVKALDQDYDYIFLLDTEGIRAPEFNALPDAGRRDNILASFAVLPADGTILLNKGEINQALEDVLPIVLYLYATSSLSKQLGGQIPSKLFFVYNQIDPSQPQKGMELLQDLVTRLQNVTHRIIEAVSSKEIPFYGFEQCRLDLKNLSNSDFRILSTNVNNPPINHPVYLFGEQSLYLRQWIDQRITNITEHHRWKPRTIIDMVDYLKIVSNMIRRAPHITSVSTSLEIFENSKLNTQIENIQHNLSSIYDQVRSKIEDTTISKYTSSYDKFNSTMLSQSQLENIINEAINNVSENMKNYIFEIQEQIFELIKGTKRELHYKEDWKRFLNDKVERSKKILATEIVGILMSFDFHGKTQNEIQQDLIRKCDQMNCINLTMNEQKTIFDDIIKNYTRKVEEEYSFESIDVSYEMKTVYNSSIVTKDIIIFNQNEICYSNGSSIQLYNDNTLLKHIEDDQSGEKFKNYHDTIFEENRKFNEAMDEIKPFINNLISNANRYEPKIVNTVLIRIQQIIHERSIIHIDNIRYIHRETFCFLEYKLIKLQNRWNLLYNRIKILEQNLPLLWGFFQNVVQGVRGIQLFQSEICNAFQHSWHDGFLKELIEDVAAEVKEQRWIGNSEILQARLDKVKIDILRQNGIKSLLKEISSTNEFYEKCVINFVQVYVNEYVHNQWKSFYNKICNALTRAGKNATSSDKDRLNVFLKTLHNQPLPSTIRSRLPLTANIYDTADNPYTDIFDNMVEKLQRCVPESPESLSRGNESQEILNRIREHGATDSAKPRCNHACRLCGAPCFRHSGHNGLHNFHHQPGALKGLSIRYTHLMVHESCYELYMRNHTFSLRGDSGPFYSYTEFPERLGYEVPVSESQRSLLGEYLVSKYHHEIAEHYGIKPNPPTPTAYDEHTLEKIEKNIERRIRSN